MLKNFLKKLLKHFEKPPVVVQPNEEELRLEREWNAKKAKYSLEYMESTGTYYVRYADRGGWLYLRLWLSGDYSYDRERGAAIKLRTQEELDAVIFRHQEWLDGGRIFLSFGG